jgi:hypothetical protein
VEPASTGLAKIFRELLEHAPAHEIPVIAWPMVCGEQVANRTRALAFSQGVLLVQVPDKDWKTQLMDLASQYVAALNTLKGERVRRIEFLLPGEHTTSLPEPGRTERK